LSRDAQRPFGDGPPAYLRLQLFPSSAHAIASSYRRVARNAKRPCGDGPQRVVHRDHSFAPPAARLRLTQDLLAGRQWPAGTQTRARAQALLGASYQYTYMLHAHHGLATAQRLPALATLDLASGHTPDQLKTGVSSHFHIARDSQPARDEFLPYW